MQKVCRVTVLDSLMIPAVMIMLYAADVVTLYKLLVLDVCSFLTSLMVTASPCTLNAAIIVSYHLF